MTAPSYLRALEPSDAEEMLGLRLKNRSWLQAFEPIRPERLWTLPEQRRELELEQELRREDRRYVHGIFLTEDDRLVGRVSLDNVVRGAWQNATLGYFVAQEHNGRGIATQAVGDALRFGFEEIGLHRVQAGVMPRNVASIRVVEKAGFRYEGMSPRYLQINGEWEDHNMYAITVEDWQGL
ncbi:MAG: GNAT family N-acetyltransferase [Actinomycetota bacterium]